MQVEFDAYALTTWLIENLDLQTISLIAAKAHDYLINSKLDSDTLDLKITLDPVLIMILVSEKLRCPHCGGASIHSGVGAGARYCEACADIFTLGQGG